MIMKKPITIFIAPLILFAGLLLSAISNSTIAQELGVYCQGPQQAYKQYSKSAVIKVQTDLYTIYKQHPDWIAAAKGKENPLNDGRIGPVTWYWVERFCRDFAFQESPDSANELPQRLDSISLFAQKYPEDINILTSADFANWCVTREQPLLDEIPQILYKGSDAELLNLIRIYQTPERVVTPITKPAQEKPVIENKKPNKLYLYVLRAEDLDTLKKPDALPAAIDSLLGAYKDKGDYKVAIISALKEQPDDIKSQAIPLLEKALEQKTTYQLNDMVLDNLSNNGLSALEIVELSKLSKDPYTDQSKFTKDVNDALKKAEAARLASLPPVAPSDASEAPSIGTTNPNNAQQAASQQLALMRVLRESRTTSLVFDEASANAVKQQLASLGKSTHIPESLANLLDSMRNIEFPDGQLMHYSLKNAIVESMGICKVNKANSFNPKITKLDKDQLEVLKQELSSLKLSSDNKSALDAIFDNTANQNGNKNCSDDYYDNLDKIYNAVAKTPIENVYRKDLPDYTDKPIKWRGDACGCIPEAIESTAYGIFPYWNVSDEAQQFDFSTHSRIGYYGISFNGNGQLTHTNTDNQNKTLLTDDSIATNDFIRVTRMYGSKMDWVIEKDWNEDLTGDDETDGKKISLIFAGLRTNLVKAMTTPMTDPASQLMPWLSLRIAPRPTKADGVTFYFKNYPDTARAKELFDAFFTALKEDLAMAAQQNSRFTNHPHHYFVNMVVNQKDYIDENSVFGNANLIQLLGIDIHHVENLTPLEMQEKTKTLILVLLKKPYYNSLAEIYATTSTKTRQITLPVMFIHYENFDATTKTEEANKRSSTDQRHKNLAFIQEGFGGGGFWPMPAWDQKAAKGFNEHLATLFALGFPQSWWAEKLCGYRWIIVGVTNIWLLLVLTIVIVAFYIYPQQCRQLPVYIDWLLKPLPLAFLIFPPLIVWVYMLIVDSHYPFFSLPSFFSILLIGLTFKAGVDYVKELKQRKPNRNLLQYHKQLSMVETKNPVPYQRDSSDESLE